MSRSENVEYIARYIVDRHNARTAGIVYIVVYVRDAVGEFNDHAFKRRCHMLARMVYDAVAHFPCKVKTGAVVFKLFHNAQALLVMRKIR